MAASSRRFTPVIIGVADVKNRSTRVEDAREPADLMLDAVRHALRDTGLDSVEELQSRIDSIDVVRTWTWQYEDLPGLLAARLEIAPPTHQLYTDHGGNQPAKLLDEAARRISFGETTVALVTGGEALASLSACAKANEIPPPGWTPPYQNGKSVDLLSMQEGDDIGGRHSIGSPVQIYPLYENGFRAHRGQSAAANNDESAQLYASFSEVAAKHPFAWNYGEPSQTTSTIGTVSKKNRLICYPYPLLMNAFNMVNLAAACLLTSTEYAQRLGIPESRWIYPLGGGGTQESDNFWERPNYFSSPAISRSIDEALRVSGLKADEIDLFDFYSCFPIVPKLACHHLGLDIVQPRKPITLLGGLTSFGGAGNNYSMHAITELVRRIRKRSAKTGLVLANGGVLSYQHVICLSQKPSKDGRFYPEKSPLPKIVTGVPVPRIVDNAEGEAIIETYTVEYSRSGSPAKGFIIGRLKSNGSRFVANAADDETLRRLVTIDTSTEPVGQSGFVFVENGDNNDKRQRNLFTIRKIHGAGLATKL